MGTATKRRILSLARVEAEVRHSNRKPWQSGEEQKKRNVIQSKAGQFKERRNSKIEGDFS